MPLKLCTYQSYDNLAKEFARDVAGMERSVFQPVYILSRSKAQKEFLKEKLAIENGIAAHLKFHTPDEILDIVHQKLSGDSPIHAEGLVWKIFKVLGQPSFQSQFDKVREYCADNEQKRMGLAVKAAQLFIKYQDEAPEILNRWRENSEEAVPDWQEYLYKELYTHGALKDKTVKLQNLKELLEIQNNQETVREHFGEIYLFDPEHLSVTDQNFVKLLSSAISLQVYYLQVVVSGEENSISSKWGGFALENMNSLAKAVTDSEERERTAKEPESLLSRIQTDFLNDLIPNKAFVKKEDDNSLIAYNSFTRVREVEALYNYLLKLLQTKEDIGARDIMVVIPDLHFYVAPIKTVFETAPFSFPYSIISRGFTPEDSFWAALEQLLDFSANDFTATGIYSLVENVWVQKAFGFQDLDRIKRAIDAANIRRSYCGEEEDESCYSSWQYGLKRLIYGYCLGNEEEMNDPENREGIILPVDFAEGEAAEDLFRLNELVEMLQELILIKEQKAGIENWEAFCTEAAENFLDPESWQLKKLQELLQSIRSTPSGEHLEIDFKAWFFRFRQLLQTEGLGSISGSGGIIFTGFYPGTALPKKVIAFLGMNFREFPRRMTPLDFDKTDTGTEAEKDRYLFLKIFQSAQENALLSYIGQDAKTNSEKPASGVVDQLLNYAKNYTTKELTVKHKLHAYHSDYYKEEKKEYFTYLANAEKIEIPLKEEPYRQEEDKKDVFLFELIQFFKDPIKSHYRKTLGIYYEEDSPLRDSEIFALSSLQHWQLKMELFQQYPALDSDRLEEQLDYLRKKFVIQGLLPLRRMGGRAVEETYPQITSIYAALEAHNAIQWEPVHLSADLGEDMILQGEVLQVDENRGLFVTVSNSSDKYRLEAYLHFLLLKATGKANEMLYMAMEDGEVITNLIKNEELTADKAKEILRKYVKYMQENLKEIQAFCLEFGDHDTIRSLDTEEKLRQYIESKLSTYDRYKIGMHPSPYFLAEHYRNQFFTSDTFLQKFTREYTSVFQEVENSFLT